MLEKVLELLQSFIHLYGRNLPIEGQDEIIEELNKPVHRPRDVTNLLYKALDWERRYFESKAKEPRPEVHHSD